MTLTRRNFLQGLAAALTAASTAPGVVLAAPINLPARGEWWRITGQITGRRLVRMEINEQDIPQHLFSKALEIVEGDALTLRLLGTECYLSFAGHGVVPHGRPFDFVMTLRETPWSEGIDIQHVGFYWDRI